MRIEVSIIIPCKNEEKYIGKLLESLVLQRLPNNFEILIADAGSTDGTLGIIELYVGLLPNLRVIGGGLPSFGRNEGVKVSRGNILLFIDSDGYFRDNDIIIESVKLLGSGYDLLGCLLNIERNWFIRFIYFWTNIIIRLSKFDKPFVVGTYFMIRKDRFLELGGFDEDLMHCEDYFLSIGISNTRFIIINKYIYTDDRRFRKMGKINIIFYFIRNMFNKNNKEYFKKDVGYWK